MEIIPAACLAIATIVGEAGAEPYAGKLAVAKVIRNRMAQKFFSDGSVAGTVLRPLQFSLWNTGTPARAKVCQISSDMDVAVESARAWKESEHSWPASFGDEDAASRILLYHADYIPKPDWARVAHFVAKINRHLFYENR